ncbi:arylsulfatase [Vallitalea sediminicola]
MKKPNILIILADDMGYSDIGCFGSEINTPNIDDLAKNGLKYTHFYNNARCCPSRASLITGLYAHQTGVGHMVENYKIPEYQGYLNDNCITIAEGLKISGYNTAMTGKWHVGGNYWHVNREEVLGQKGYPNPMQRGFDRFYGTLEGAGDYYNPTTLMEDGDWITVNSENDFYYTERISEKTCEYIDTFSEENNPFFLYVAFNAPHWPLHAREDDIKKYEGKYMSGWDYLRYQRYKKQIELGITEDIWNISLRDLDAMPWESVENKEWEDIKMAVYAAQVEEMDKAIGEIYQKLEAKGIADDTMIMFMSDNGGCAEKLPSGGWVLGCANEQTLDGKSVEIGNSSRKRPGNQDTFMSYGLPWANLSNTPFKLFKHWIHEGGISTPLIINWKNGIENPGRIIHSPMHFIDIMPTILDVAEVEYPSNYKNNEIIPYSGESFKKSLNGSWKRKEPIFWEHEGNCGVRNGKYKLVKKYPGAFELYDMEKDRTEQNDISKLEPIILKELKIKYYEWAKKTKVKEWQEILKINE